VHKKILRACDLRRRAIAIERRQFEPVRELRAHAAMAQDDTRGESAELRATTMTFTI